MYSTVSTVSDVRRSINLLTYIQNFSLFLPERGRVGVTVRKGRGQREGMTGQLQTKRRDSGEVGDC